MGSKDYLYKSTDKWLQNIIMNIFDKLKLLVLINKFYSQVKEAKMNASWKTTVSGLVATAGFILKLFKVDLPDEVSNALITVGVFLIAFFAKDSNATGGAVKQ